MAETFVTYWDNNYFETEPLRFFSDVFCVGFLFKMKKKSVIYPKFSYILNGKFFEIFLPPQEANMNEFVKVYFGPFYKMNQSAEDRIDEVKLTINCDVKCVFKKYYMVPDFRSYSYQEQFKNNNLEYKFIVSSSYGLPGNNNSQLTTYSKLVEVIKNEKPDYVMCTGDIVNLEPLNLTSKQSIQGAYDQLRTFPTLDNVWSNSTWISACNDNELGYNAPQSFNPNINVMREQLQENFPLNLMLKDSRTSAFTIKNISYILLDNVSNKVINSNYTGIGDNKFNQILGDEQLNFLLNCLTNATNFGLNAPVFILIGKSIFSTTSDTLVYCPKERDAIFSHIKFLGLRNVVFLVGDSHQSDMSEFVVNTDTNQKVREIRNSAIGLTPKNLTNDNPYQIPCSLVSNVNNFGLIKVSGTHNDYKIKYDVYTKEGIVFTYSWNTNY
jgi:hypothetical protein